MSTADTRFSALLEQFTGDLQSTNEDVRRRAVDELYALIIAQYADAPSDVVTSIAEQVQEFVRKKMNNPNEINDNRAALLVILCFVCAGQNFYIELSNKLEPTLRGYKQMSVDANLCELVVKLTVILVKGCGRMSIDQFSHDVPKAIERISQTEKHETRRYSGITILKEIALAAPSRYYHLITPVEQFFEHLFGTMTDPKQYIREAFAETMHATLVVLIDREREEQKNNDITTGRDLTSSNTTHMSNIESNTFIKAYTMAYNEVMKCLAVDTTKSKSTQKDERIHGGLLLLNELLRVSDVKFENICQDLIQPYSAPKPKPISYKDVHRARVALTFERTGPLSPMDIIDNPEQSQIQVQSSLIRSIMLENFLNICNQVFQYRQQPKPMIANVLIRILPRLASLNYKLFSHQPYIDATMNFIFERINSKEIKELKDRQLAFHALGLMILADKTSRINDTDSLITTTALTKDMTKILECLQQTFIPISSSSIAPSITSTHSHRRNNSVQSTISSSSSTQQQQQQQQQSAMINLLPCRYSSPDSSVFACITMIGEAGPDASKCLDVLLEQLLHCGLNHSLLFCLEKLCSMPLIHTDTKRKIHQGLLENLRLILCNPLAYNTNLTVEQIDIILITLQTLRIFDFEAQAIEPFFIDILNTRFIEHDIVRIRIESIITITHLLRKLLSPPSQTILSSNTTTSLIAANKLRIKIGYITQRILTIGVTDLDPDVRYNVFLTLQDDFKQFLAKSEALELLFFSVHDECHEIRELALSLIGRLSNINPAYVLPPLRHLLLQLLTELEIGCSLSGKEQASRLLGQLIANTPRIVRPYMQSITQALLPLIKQHEQHSNVLIALVRTVGEQAQVCGIDLDQRIHDLFPILINMMQDTSNYRKREVALWTIGQIVESCCYVIEPLQKYPILLDVLLQFLKSPEEMPFRRETIRVLGFLGAIDPYHVRSSNDPLRSLSFDVNDITLTHRVRFEPDPIEISSNELLVASGAQSLHDFYTSMAIYVCLRVLKDPNTPQLHLKAVQAISIILQWLGNICTQYVSLVLPRLLSVVRSTDDRNLVPYFRQINIIIISIKSSIIDYVNDVVQLIRDYWDTHSDLQILLIQTIESLAAALDSEFRHYIHLLLPFVMKTFRIDTNNSNINHFQSTPNQDRQLILSQMFSTLNKFGKTLKPHFNVVLPSILDIASTSTYPIKLRQEALDTIEQLADKVYLSDYVSAILQILLRIIRKTPQLQLKCLDIILIIAQQMGKHFLVFNSLVSKTMDDMKLQHSKYELYISKLKDSSFVDVQTESIVNANQILNSINSNEQMKKTDDKIIYTIRTEQLRLHWSQAQQRNAKDLPMWLNKFQQLVLEQSPVYPLKAMGTCLAQVSPSIPRDLFNASFISCWSELNSYDRQSLTNALTYVLSVCDKPDVIQTILNLAEFRNHCDLKLKLERQQKSNKRNDETNLNDTNEDLDKEKNNKKDSNFDTNDDDNERSLIDIHLLSDKAFSVRAYAKALRYKEEEFQRQHDSALINQTASVTSDIVESLISINHELQQSEAAYGALQYAKNHNIKIKGLWYEKLNQWERALRNYEFLKTNDSSNMDIHLGRMRCMQALGSWSELKDLAFQVWETTESIRDDQSLNSLPFSTSLIEKSFPSTVSMTAQGTFNGRELKKILQQKIAPMATRAAWSLGDMSDMEKYYIHIPDTKFEGAYYRAVDAIRNDNFRQAQDSIDLARELLDVELTTLANESYNRAYSAMINAQLLSELEEVWYYKILPERRQSICEIWQKRMQGNQPIIDDYHRLLLTHSLCLPMTQDLQSWIKLANLCRKSNRLTMADFIFKELAHTVLTDQTNLNRDISIISPTNYQSQPSHHFNIQTTTTPAFSIQSQQTYYHPSLIDQQLVKYEKSKYDWHCLVALRERLLLERQNRKQQISNNDGTPSPHELSHNTISLSLSTSSSSLSSTTATTTTTTTNTDNINIKLEQNRQDQLKLIEDMKEMIVKTCLPALDHLRKQAATSTGTVQQQSIITTSGGTTPAAAGSTLAGATQIPPLTSLSVTTANATPPINSATFSLITSSGLSGSSQPINQRELRLRQLISKCYLRLGTWQHDLFGMTDDGILTDIMKNYEHAWTYDDSNYKAWNAYAVLNYDAVNYFKQRVQDLSRNSQQQQQQQQQAQAAPVSDSLTSPPRTTQPSPPTPQPPQPTLDTSNENYRMLTTKMIHCTIPAVKGLLKSIVLSKAKHCLQNTLRLLTLWFEYGQYREVYDALGEGIRTVPVEVWLQVLPQLIARIDSPRPLVHQLIRHLLIDVGRQHPQALIYPLVVASKSVVREREVAANRVLNNMREHSHTLVQQAMVVSEELIRISILWHEKWHEGLEEASRQYFGERSIPGMIDTLEPLHAAIERGSTTLNERTFLDSYSNDLTQAHECIRSFQRSRDQRELHQAWDLYHQVFKRIHAQLPNITSLELDYVSPRLATHCRDLELAVPGTYEPNKPPITIRSVHARINVITSKQRPRKISITGSDGYEYVFLLKGHEDLRQDERVMQLFGLVNEFLSANDETRRRNFIIQRYPVIPLAPNNGLLGWVAQCDTFHALIKEHREKARIMLNAEHRYMQGKAPHYDQLPLINKVEVFEYALNLLDGDDLAKILWHKSSSAEIWLDRRSNYTRSLAVMSMVGYILGLGDRHPSNLMLDRASGKVVHIDFGDCFEVAMTREKFPEKIPFRLTRMLRKAMEVTGIDGTFRMTCEHVMDVLRKNRDSLMAVLEAFVHDPLLNWRLLESNNNEQNVATSVASNRSPQTSQQQQQQQQQTHYQPHLSTVNEEDNEHESTIGGTAQQQNIQQQNLTAQPGRTIRAVEIMNRVREKLTGSDFHREQPVDIPTQVELLIKQATSHENLCQSYIGWCPFW